MVDDRGLKRKLRAVPDVVLKAVRAQMEDGASLIVREMKALAPYETGALRDSIGWTWGNAPKGSLSIASVKGRVAGLFITIYVGTRDKSLGDQDAYYARWQEFGTKNMPANPFFFVVWRANRRSFRSGINRAVRNAVKTI
ncbi:HK97-gp10 family putative phage morphogenesis protein [Paracoccus sp. SSK6]|uniref:HK97-gp10 family putative phage morphogenesis protein n=1 Tax=Paracoccus sp. SSK6 TaxID=3143131 RepID=UPI00321A6912